MKERIVAPPDFNRWKIPPVAVAIHLCIGSVYSWSIFNPALTRELGVVTSSAGDWDFNSVVWTFSVAILFVGIAAALGGRWLERVGPRCVGVTAACLWGGGLLVAALGVYLHQLWLVFFGFGVLGGCGIGLGYVSPVATLIRWFPDRRGLAAGMAIMGFGGGAIIGVPLKEFLIRTFFEAPQYLGPVSDVELVTEQGRRYANVSGESVEVVVASASDVANMFAPAAEGVYVVGTGATGAAPTFIALALIYFTAMAIASLLIRIPPLTWQPGGRMENEITADTLRRLAASDVHVSQVHRIPQFYLLWILLCFSITAGIGILGVAKTMMMDTFGASMSSVVTPAFAASYVLMISVFNLGGRFFWASISDYVGRRRAFYMMTGLGALLYLSIPIATSAAGGGNAVLWLIMFCAATMLAFTIFGGAFATIPAYVSDLFGLLHVGGIHGRLLTAWSVAGLLGPFVLTYVREWSIRRSIEGLAEKVDPAKFEAAFGSSIANLEELIAAKTVTISALMEIAPVGTVDPSPSLYNLTMFIMAGLMVIAFIANRLIRPVDPKFYAPNTNPDSSAWEGR